MVEDKNKDDKQSIEKKVLHSEDGMDNDLTPGSAAENKANETKHGGTAAGTEMLLQMEEEEEGDAEGEQETARRSQDKGRGAEQGNRDNGPDDYKNEFKDNG